MNTPRVARNISAGVVATIAAWSSYSHMTHVAMRYGERPEVAYVLPLSADGMLIVASVAMVDDRRDGRRPRMSARIAFAIGVTASVAANVAAAQPGIGARIVAGWPALALLLVVELLSRRGRRSSDHAPPVASPAESTMNPPAEPHSPDRSALTGRPPARRTTTAARVERALARRPNARPAEIAAKLGVSERTVTRYWPRLAGDTVSPTPTPVNGSAVAVGPSTRLDSRRAARRPSCEQQEGRRRLFGPTMGNPHSIDRTRSAEARMRGLGDQAAVVASAMTSNHQWSKDWVPNIGASWRSPTQTIAPVP